MLVFPEIQIGQHVIYCYHLINALALCASFICNLCFLEREHMILCKHPLAVGKFSQNRLSMEWSVVWLFLITAVQYAVSAALSSVWAQIMGTGNVDYFGTAIWSPVVLFFVFWLLRIHPIRQLDLIVPAYAIALCFFKLACFAAGCCNGREWKFGFYSVLHKRYEFPVQLVEMALAAMILVVLLWMIKKRYFAGRLYPVYLILYSATRFFSEFLREADTVLMGLQLYQLECIAGVIIGIAELLLLQKYAPAISARFSPPKQKKKEEEPEEEPPADKWWMVDL